MESENSNSICPIKKRRGRPSKRHSRGPKEQVDKPTRTRGTKRKRSPSSTLDEDTDPEACAFKAEFFGYLQLIDTRPIRNRRDRIKMQNKNLYCMTRRSHRVQQKKITQEQKDLEMHLRSLQAQESAAPKRKKRKYMGTYPRSEKAFTQTIDSADSSPPPIFIETALEFENKKSAADWMMDMKPGETTFFVVSGGSVSPTKRIYTVTKTCKPGQAVLSTLSDYFQPESVSTLPQKLIVSGLNSRIDVDLSLAGCSSAKDKQYRFANNNPTNLARPSTSGMSVMPFMSHNYRVPDTDDEDCREANLERSQNVDGHVSHLHRPAPFDIAAKMTKDKDPTGTKRKRGSHAHAAGLPQATKDAMDIHHDVQIPENVVTAPLVHQGTSASAQQNDQSSSQITSSEEDNVITFTGQCATTRSEPEELQINLESDDEGQSFPCRNVHNITDELEVELIAEPLLRPDTSIQEDELADASEWTIRRSSILGSLNMTNEDPSESQDETKLAIKEEMITRYPVSPGSYDDSLTLEDLRISPANLVVSNTDAPAQPAPTENVFHSVGDNWYISTNQCTFVTIDEAYGPVLSCVVYAQYVVIRQEKILTFWERQQLGELLTTQGMWQRRGWVYRVRLDNNFTLRQSNHSVMYCSDGGPAYLELWTREQTNETDGENSVNVTAAIYSSPREGSCIRCTVLDLCTISEQIEEFQYVLLPSQNIVVMTWCTRSEGTAESWRMRSYRFATDYESVTILEDREPLVHPIYELRLADDDTLAGIDNDRIWLWNTTCPTPIATISMPTTAPPRRTMCVQRVGDLIYVVQHLISLNVLRLICAEYGSNQIKLSWVYEVDSGLGRVRDVCIEGGVMAVFCESAVAAWRIGTGEEIGTCHIVNGQVWSHASTVLYRRENRVRQYNLLLFIIDALASRNFAI